MANKKVEFTTWGAADIDADPTQIGKAGSPTNVKAVKSIVFKAKETKTLTSSDEDINNLMKELIESNTIG
jgi:electron transfer flavoprotein beta subunit